MESTFSQNFGVNAGYNNNVASQYYEQGHGQVNYAQADGGFDFESEMNSFQKIRDSLW